MTKEYSIVGDEDIYEGFIAQGNLCDYLELEDVCDLLNNLSEDNQQLRILVDSLKMENKKLKGRLTDLGVEYF